MNRSSITLGGLFRPLTDDHNELDPARRHQMSGLFRWWSMLNPIVVVNHATTTFWTGYHDLRR